MSRMIFRLMTRTFSFLCAGHKKKKEDIIIVHHIADLDFPISELKVLFRSSIIIITKSMTFLGLFRRALIDFHEFYLSCLIWSAVSDHKQFARKKKKEILIAADCVNELERCVCVCVYA